MKHVTTLVAAPLAAVLLFSVSLIATADDVFPAPWRGRANTTFQATTFSQSWQVSWESVSNPYGNPDIWMYADVWQWDEQAQGRSGVVSWGNFQNGFSMEISNTEDPNLDKRIWVQVTYYGAGPNIWEAFGMGTGGGVWVGPPISRGSVTHGDGWVTEAGEMVIHPNPPAEFVGVRWTSSGMVDQILVETICVPEPAFSALAAAALTLLCVARSSRRRTS